PEPAEAGRVRYGPIDLQPGKDPLLELLVTPSTVTGWQDLAASSRPFDVDLTSSYGMQTKFKPAFQTLGPPLFGRIDRHGRPIFKGLLLAFFGTLLALLTVQRFGVVRRFWSFRPGTILSLGTGPIRIGDPDDQGGAALILPNSGSSLDDTTVGSVSLAGRQQRVESSSGYLVFAKPNLSAGDAIVVSEDPPNTELWGLEYSAYMPGQGGEVEMRKSAAQWTLGRLLRSVAVGLLFLWGLSIFLGAGIAAALAYHFTFIESFYLWLLR
ncbi:MAG TPA: hypothetical protein VEO74_19355, partial [Thermoanaerobaculia bacterium]|nr:hypothetical protein [Thermoanaerobaculia bacterium]